MELFKVKITILIFSLVWIVVFFAISGLIYFLVKKREGIVGRQYTPLRVIVGTMMIGASSIPAAIQAVYSGGEFGLAGLPLALVGIGFLFWKSPSDSDEFLPKFTFREKSTAISLTLVILLYGMGSAVALSSGGVNSVVGWLIPATLLMMLLMAISHMVLAAFHRPEEEDERDQAVAFRSTRIGYAALCVGIWFCLAMLFFARDVPTIAFTLFAVFVLAEVVRMASSLVYSRFDI
jgi:hypothetical protein